MGGDQCGPGTMRIGRCHRCRQDWPRVQKILPSSTGKLRQTDKGGGQAHDSLDLYIDQSFSLFPKTNFNRALGAFLVCLHEFGEHISRHDPTLSLPYSINSEEGKVNDYLVFLGNDEDIWTKGLKFMLSDIKWIIAWAAKHSYDYI